VCETTATIAASALAVNDRRKVEIVRVFTKWQEGVIMLYAKRSGRHHD
jgi:hypothetical protein